MLVSSSEIAMSGAHQATDSDRVQERLEIRAPTSSSGSQASGAAGGSGSGSQSDLSYIDLKTALASARDLPIDVDPVFSFPEAVK